MRFRIYRQSRFVLRDHLAQQRINRRDRIDFVTPEFNPVCLILITRVNLNNVSPHAKAAAVKIDIYSLILQFNQLFQKIFTLDFCPRFDK